MTLRVILLLSLLSPATLAAPLFETTDLFKAGAEGYAHYRIPGIVVTANGTLLAYCEARRVKGSDWGRIDVMMRRSVDGGRTWDEPRIVARPPKVEANPLAAKYKRDAADITVNNPVAIADRKPGVVHFLYCAEYSRCFYTRSEDDGRTFSDPIDITPTFEQFKPEYDWKVIASGPGHGIELDSGRLLVTAWLSTGTGGHAHRPSCVGTIYSDDGGKTWSRGAIVVSDPEPKNPSETAAVQLSDGRVMLNIRHESRGRGRAVTTSADGVKEWTAVRYDAALPEPVCMGSLVGMPRRGAEPMRILFSNPHNAEGTARKNVTVKMSADDGKTWPVARAIDAGPSGYSDLAVAADGTIFCFYERGVPGASAFDPASLRLVRFNLEWLEQGTSDRAR